MYWGNNLKTPGREENKYPGGQSPSKFLSAMPFRLLKNIGNTSLVIISFKLLRIHCIDDKGDRYPCMLVYDGDLDGLG